MHSTCLVHPVARSAGMGNAGRGSQPVAEAGARFTVKRDEVWLQAVAGKLREWLLKALPALQGHPSSAVRKALAVGVLLL